MEAEAGRPVAVIGIVPYHLPMLEDRQAIEPLVKAFAEACGTTLSDVSVRREGPTQTEGVEAAITFVMQNPFFLGAVGAVAGGALKRFGENIADWISSSVGGLFSSKEQPQIDHEERESIGLELMLLPSSAIREGHRFSLTIPIEVGKVFDELVTESDELPAYDKTEPPMVYYVMGHSGLGDRGIRGASELRQKMAASFEEIEPRLKVLANEMRNSRTPVGITYATLEFDSGTKECCVSASQVLLDGTNIPYRGTFTRDGMRWDRA